MKVREFEEEARSHLENCSAAVTDEDEKSEMLKESKGEGSNLSNYDYSFENYYCCSQHLFRCCCPGSVSRWLVHWLLTD